MSKPQVLAGWVPSGIGRRGLSHASVQLPVAAGICLYLRFPSSSVSAHGSWTRHQYDPTLA